jgi:NTP pyrophosphatase (non-canonical NTP hydrolase)
MALAGEVGELSECFQWLNEAQSQTLDHDQLAAVREEMADVLLYLVRLADKLDIDLVQAAQDKIHLNAQKYPVAQAKGNAKKYTEFEKG